MVAAFEAYWERYNLDQETKEIGRKLFFTFRVIIFQYDAGSMAWSQ